MRKYSFPATLALVCFLGGYVTCHSRATLAQHVRESQRQQHDYKELLAVARIEAARLADGSKIIIFGGAGDAPVNPTVEGWNQGLIAPMIPPKRVAP